VTAGRRRLAAAAAAVLAALAVVLATATAAHGPRPPEPGELVVSFLDVGQGDATLLQKDGVAVLVDTGPPDGPILERLDEAGVGRLDLLVLTHAQSDHEGAALAVIGEHRPRAILNGGAGWPSPVQRRLAAAARGARVLPARAGQRLALGDLRFHLLWPPPLPRGFVPEGDPNDRAIVAHVSAGTFDLLLPADAESDVTAALDLPDVEALKVAHHGSADEGLPLLLDRLEPDVAAIEVGRGNPYGHPAPSTLTALREVPTVVRTDVHGTVRLRVSGGAMRLEAG
jgi:competence protein ComEC